MAIAWALLVTVVILAVAGVAAPPPAVAAPARRLFVVADSVMLGAAPSIHSAFSGWDVHIEGHEGIFTNDAAELAWSHRDEIGPVAIVGTGYNYPVWNPALFDAWIDQMMQRLTDAGAHYVLWATLREPPLGQHGVVSVWEKSHIADHYPAANAQLRAAQGRWPQLRIVDWNAVAWADGLTWDGLHLTPAGSALMADLLVDEVGGIGRLGANQAIVVRTPFGTTAAVLNLTATWARSAGYVTVWPCDQPKPVTSNLNFTRHQTVANLVVTRVAPDGSICISPSADAHVVVDLEGTFGPRDGLVTENPVRVLDTRAGGGPRPGAGAVARVPLGAAGVPPGARAAVVNVTATDSTAAGYVTAWACDAARPTASVVNHGSGVTAAALAIVPVAADGTICLYSFAPTHLVVDVAGWFTPASAYEPVSPSRLLDTRQTGGRLPAGGTAVVALPAGASGAVLTVTAVGASAAGYLTAHPCGNAPAVASMLDYEVGEPVANLVMVGAGLTSAACIDSYAAADVVVDLAGTFDANSGFVPIVPERVADTRPGL